MAVNMELHFNYFLLGVFLSWIFIYIHLPPPEVYELNKEKFDNKCF